MLLYPLPPPLHAPAPPPELVSKHYDLGRLLVSTSDNEVTSVSKVMKDVGGIEQKTASSW